MTARKALKIVLFIDSRIKLHHAPSSKNRSIELGSLAGFGAFFVRRGVFGSCFDIELLRPHILFLEEKGHASRAGEAQKVFEEDLQKYPENGWSLSGLQQSLVAQGKSDQTIVVKTRFDKAWASADVTLEGSRF